MGASEDEDDVEIPDPSLDRYLRVCNMRFAAVRNSGELREPSKVAVVDISDESKQEALAKRLATLLDDDWKVDEYFGKPTVCILITGGAQDFRMLPRVERVFREGLVRAAQITNAWVFTGGSASGVMKHVGQALAPHPDVPCIGMPLYGNVVGNDQIEIKLGELPAREPDERPSELVADEYDTVDYVYSEELNSKDSAALEPHHSHFILVDTGKRGSSAWGGEIEFGLLTQLAYCELEALPAVMLVVQGGPNTLKMVVSAVKRDVPVVVVASSGGAATAIRDFLTRTGAEEEAIGEAEARFIDAEAEEARARQAVADSAGLPVADRVERRRALRQARQRRERASQVLLALERRLLAKTAGMASFGSKVAELRALKARAGLIQLFELDPSSTADISQSILAGVRRSPRLPPEKLLELAIVWNNLEMISEVLTGHDARGKAGSVERARSSRTLSRASASSAEVLEQKRRAMCKALQLALEMQRTDVVTMLLSNGADINSVALSRLYGQREKNPFRLFAYLQQRARRAHEELAGGGRAGANGRLPRGASRGVGHGSGSAAEAGRAGGARRAARVDSSILRQDEVAALVAEERVFLSDRVFKPFIEIFLEPEFHRTDFSPAARRPAAAGPGGGGGGSPSASGARAAADAQAEADRAAAAAAAASGTPPPTPPLGAPARGFAPARGASGAAPALRAGWRKPATEPAAGESGGLAGFPAGTRIEDVYWWAVLMGDMELATVLWRFSKQHLRLALLAAEVLENMMTRSAQGQKHRDDIEPMKGRWQQVALDVLEHVQPTAKDKRTVFEVAEEVLVHPVAGHTAIDLAMALGAKSFTAHRYCQLIMSRRWTGHSRSGRRARLRLEDDTAPHWKVVLKLLLPWFWVEDVLDYFGLPWVAKVVENAHPRRARRDSVAPAHPAQHDEPARAGWWHVYTIPVVKFWSRTLVTHVGLTLISLGLIAGTWITEPQSLSRWPRDVLQAVLEVLYLFWVLGYALDWAEVHARRLLPPSGGGGGGGGGGAQLAAHMSASGLKPAWAWIDSTSLLSFALNAGLRSLYLLLLALRAVPEGRSDFLSEWLFPISMAISALFAFGRFIGETLMVFQQLGVLTICMRDMFAKNINSWAVVMAIVILAFGLAFVALVPSYPLAGTCGGGGGSGLPDCPTRFATSPFFIPVWAVFGDFSIADMEDARPLAPSIFLIGLLVVAQVLLLNLLIAMMTETYTNVMSSALIEWKYDHMLLVDYYKTTATAAPPPLNLLLLPPRLAMRLWPRGRARRGAEAHKPARVRPAGGGARADGSSEVEHRDETRAFHAYMRTIEESAAQDVSARVQGVTSIVGGLELKQMEDREALDSHVRALRGEIEFLRAQVAHVPRSRLRELAAKAAQGGGAEPLSTHALARAGLRTLHFRARSEENKAYEGQRTAVPDWRVPWEVEWASYEPNEWTHPVVLGDPPNGKPRPVWADPADALQVDFTKRRSHEQEIVCSPIGRPLNPRGRTGISGRGLLGKWGPNHAADPIVLRRWPGSAGAQPPKLQMVAIMRADVSKWAIPGGMVDEGELVSETLRREFSEEAGSLADPLAKEELEDRLDEVFGPGGDLVYEGYVDDPRNTDNAWMETTVHAFFIDDELAAQLTLEGGSDAMDAQWLDLEETGVLADDVDQLYADHKQFVLRALPLVHRRIERLEAAAATGGGSAK